ncbi:hypothetical protein EV360DRAFT_56594, partial [Lentinula raphanica]
QLIALTGSEGAVAKDIVIDKSLAYLVGHLVPLGDPQPHYVGELLYKGILRSPQSPHLSASGSQDSARLLAEMLHSIGNLPSTTFSPFAPRGTIPYVSSS